LDTLPFGEPLAMQLKSPNRTPWKSTISQSIRWYSIPIKLIQR
jgi:hypothetical protein